MSEPGTNVICLATYRAARISALLRDGHRLYLSDLENERRVLQARFDAATIETDEWLDLAMSICDLDAAIARERQEAK
jgi:hypothetical protein